MNDQKGKRWHLFFFCYSIDVAVSAQQTLPLKVFAPILSMAITGCRSDNTTKPMQISAGESDKEKLIHH
jgi:hypothetical protein